MSTQQWNFRTRR